MRRVFTDAEFLALQEAHGGILKRKIPDQTVVDEIGIVLQPGMRVYKRLQKEGLLEFVEPDDEWEENAFLTDSGLTLLETMRVK